MCGFSWDLDLCTGERTRRKEKKGVKVKKMDTPVVFLILFLLSPFFPSPRICLRSDFLFSYGRARFLAADSAQACCKIPGREGVTVGNRGGCVVEGGQERRCKARRTERAEKEEEVKERGP